MAEKIKIICPDCGARLTITKDEDGEIKKKWTSKKKKGDDDDDDDKGVFATLKEVFTE